MVLGWCAALLTDMASYKYLDSSFNTVTDLSYWKQAILWRCGAMGNFVHTAFKAYCGVLLGPVWSATYDIGINTINSLVNVVKFAMDDWFN